MPPSKSRSTKQKRLYDSFGLLVLDFDATVLTGVNHEIHDRRLRHSHTPVWRFDLILDVECAVIWPEERWNETLDFWLSGRERRPKWYDETLDDRRVVNDQGTPVYQRVRGEDRAVYDLPSDIGFIERAGRNDRGLPNWSATAWMKPSALRDMLMLSQGRKPTYMHVTGFREGRVFSLTAVEMSLGDEDDRRLGSGFLAQRPSIMI